MKEGRSFKIAIAVFAVVAAVCLLIPANTQAASLSELLKRQAELQAQEKKSREAIDQKKREASNIQDAIEDIDDDIAYTNNRITNTESQIETTNQVITALQKDIATNQAELDKLNTELKNAYVSLYELSQTSTIEILLQGNSLEDMISQTQYIQSLQSDLQENIEEVNSIKAELESKKNETESQKSNLEDLKTNLSSSKASLGAKKTQKNSLLTQTQGEQSRYEQLLAQIKSEASKIGDEIYRARQAAGGFLSQGGTGGYPWANSCDGVDPWKYYTCQCTSYAAWRFLQVHGVPFDNTRPGSGSAYNWPNLAADQGYSVSSTPSVGAAVSWNRPLFAGDQWGHVAIVEAVYSSTDIVVSEYNWSPAKKFSQRRINPYSHGTPRYITP
jgi:surface antigen/uncharacterized coiled-coil protein SlyX